MKKEDLKLLLANENFDKAYTVFNKLPKGEDWSKLEREYEPKKHLERLAEERPVRIIDVDSGMENEKGEPILTKKPVTPNRIVVNYQKKIVQRRAAFLLGKPIELSIKDTATPEEKVLLEAVNAVWDKCKLKYKNFDIAESVMKETRCAEIWYFVDVDSDYWAGTALEGSKRALNMLVVSPSRGDILRVVKDGLNNLIAFIREYPVEVDGKKIAHVDVYTDTEVHRAVRGDIGWSKKVEAHGFNKIPVIFGEQDAAEWADQNTLINRTESLYSSHSDSNDKIAFPILAVEGNMRGITGQDESARLLQLSNGAKAGYVQVTSSPESFKLEKDNIKSDIFENSSTPDISFENMLKVGGEFSGVALRFLFLDPHMAAAAKEYKIFGEYMQRRINLQVSGLVIIKSELAKVAYLNITPKFSYFLPDNQSENLDIIIKAKNNGLISAETAVRMAALVSDYDAEYTKIVKEKEAEIESNAENF